MKKLLSSIFCPAFILAFATLAPTAFAQKAERPNWVVGDKWEYKTLRRNDGNRVSAFQHEVEKVADGKVMIRSSGKNAEGVFVPGALLTYSGDMNYMTRTGNGLTRTPDAQFLNFPLENDKKYAAENAWANTSNARTGKEDYKVTVTGPEEITVEAGVFKAYKVTAKGFWTALGLDWKGGGSISQTFWYSPEIKRWVKWETQSRDGSNRLWEDTVEELTKYTPGK